MPVPQSARARSETSMRNSWRPLTEGQVDGGRYSVRSLAVAHTRQGAHESRDLTPFRVTGDGVKCIQEGAKLSDLFGGGQAEPGLRTVRPQALEEMVDGDLQIEAQFVEQAGIKASFAAFDPAQCATGQGKRCFESSNANAQLDSPFRDPLAKRLVELPDMRRRYGARHIRRGALD